MHPMPSSIVCMAGDCHTPTHLHATAAVASSIVAVYVQKSIRMHTRRASYWFWLALPLSLLLYPFLLAILSPPYGRPLPSHLAPHPNRPTVGMGSI